MTRKYATYAELHKAGPYFKGRWVYYNTVIKWLAAQPEGLKVLELGPHGHPVVHGCDTMDVVKGYGSVAVHHDARKIPWPVESSSYDVFIALQVWEHLGTKQPDAFREVMRISKKAALSFPYKWEQGHVSHNGITDEIIAGWTLGVKPTNIILCHTHPWRRAVYFFDFS